MHKLLKHKIKSTVLIAAIFTLSLSFLPGLAMPAYANKVCGGPPVSNQVTTSIDLGCSTQGNPILDLLFGIVKFLSDGVGIVVVASVVLAGVQYTTARSDPQAVNAAVTRLQSSLIALAIFIFGWALLQWLIPGGLFNAK